MTRRSGKAATFLAAQAFESVNAAKTVRLQGGKVSVTECTIANKTPTT
jgi:hypothetical protein